MSDQVRHPSRSCVQPSEEETAALRRIESEHYDDDEDAHAFTSVASMRLALLKAFQLGAGRSAPSETERKGGWPECVYKTKDAPPSARVEPEWRSVLSELADLMDDVRSGDYKPDSFTTQPARALLSHVEAQEPGNGVSLNEQMLRPATPVASAPSSTATQPVAWRYRFMDSSHWKYVESEDDCNPSPHYNREPLYTVSATGANDEARAILEVLVGLKLIKRRIEDGTVTPQDEMIYNTTKEAIWEKADALFPNLRSPDGSCAECRNKISVMSDHETWCSRYWSQP